MIEQLFIRINQFKQDMALALNLAVVYWCIGGNAMRDRCALLLPAIRSQNYHPRDGTAYEDWQMIENFVKPPPPEAPDSPPPS